jgi:hypothetical protein
MDVLHRWLLLGRRSFFYDRKATRWDRRWPVCLRVPEVGERVRFLRVR